MLWEASFVKGNISQVYSYSNWQQLFDTVYNSRSKGGEYDSNDCTLGVINPTSGRMDWVKIHCDHRLNISTVICERKPVNAASVLPPSNLVLYIDSSDYLTNCVDQGIEDRVMPGRDPLYCDDNDCEQIRELNIEAMTFVNHCGTKTGSDHNSVYIRCPYCRIRRMLPTGLRQNTDILWTICKRECSNLIPKGCIKRFSACINSIARVKYDALAFSVTISNGTISLPDTFCQWQSFAIDNYCIHAEVKTIWNSTLNNSYNILPYSVSYDMSRDVFTAFMSTTPLRYIYTDTANDSTQISMILITDTPRRHITSSCHTALFTCVSTVECISELYINDGFDDCPDESDEKVSHQVTDKKAYQLKTPFHFRSYYYFYCNSSHRVSWLLVCDQRPHCHDGQDETYCITFHDILIPQNANGDPIHCLTSVTEYLEQFLDPVEGKRAGPSNVNISHVRCSDRNRRCISVYAINDLHDDCGTGGEDEPILNSIGIPLTEWNGMCKQEDHIPCLPGHPHCFPVHALCVYDVDVNGKLLYCGNGAHLSYCGPHQCPGRFKCHQSYCVSAVRVCDGVEDCVRGEDERGCGQNLTCPGMFRCKAGGCVTRLQACDGRNDCRGYADDESLCPFPQFDCPHSCVCSRRSMVCDRPDARALNLSLYRSLHLTTEAIIPTLKNSSYLMRLSISGSNLSIIDPFPKMQSLILLDISDTYFGNMKSKLFSGLQNLQVLLLANNWLETLHGDLFAGLASLQVIDVSKCKLKAIIYQPFSPLVQLKELHISDNELLSWSLDFQVEFRSLSYLNIYGISFEELNVAGVGNISVELNTSIHELCCWRSVFTCVSFHSAGKCKGSLKPYVVLLTIAGLMLVLMHASLLMIQRRSLQKNLYSVSWVSIHVFHSVNGVYLLLVAYLAFLTNESRYISERGWILITCHMAAALQLLALLGSLLMKSVHEYTICRNITSLIKKSSSKAHACIAFACLSVLVLLIVALTLWLNVAFDLQPVCSVFNPRYRVTFPFYVLLVFIVFPILLSLYCVVRINWYIYKTKRGVSGMGKSRATNGQNITSLVLVDNVLYFMVSVMVIHNFFLTLFNKLIDLNQCQIYIETIYIYTVETVQVWAGKLS